MKWSIFCNSSALFDPASAVRNAQTFGAKAVILFPDPNNYILTNGSKIGKQINLTYRQPSIYAIFHIRKWKIGFFLELTRLYLLGIFIFEFIIFKPSFRVPISRIWRGKPVLINMIYKTNTSPRIPSKNRKNKLLVIDFWVAVRPISRLKQSYHLF